MVVLGLGSNIGDRLANLRKAVDAIQEIPALSIQQISPVYMSDALLPENAPSDWDQPYLNLALRCETTLAPLDLLKTLKNIEWSIGRKPEARHWGPRIMDIDILALDDTIIVSDPLTVPHESLLSRPFALWPLADVAPMWRFPLSGEQQHKTAAELVEHWGSRFSDDAPFHTRQISQHVDTPRLVGIINVTPDSFSDGGKFLEPQAALQQALALVKAGAEILDIGAESTAPLATLLTADEEWRRLEPVLHAIKTQKEKFLIAPKISIDTRHWQVAEKAIALGADWINDVSGLEDPLMRQVIAKANIDCVIMHHMSLPASKNHVLPRDCDPVETVFNWGKERIALLEKDGISREKIIFDPGIGFGKTPEQSLTLIKHCDRFHELGTRLLIGHSRKSFLSLLTAETFAERDIETCALSLLLKEKAVNYLRVHNVAMHSRFFNTAAIY